MGLFQSLMTIFKYPHQRSRAFKSTQGGGGGDFRNPAPHISVLLDPTTPCISIFLGTPAPCILNSMQVWFWPPTLPCILQFFCGTTPLYFNFGEAGVKAGKLPYFGPLTQKLGCTIRDYWKDGTWAKPHIQQIIFLITNLANLPISIKI